MPSPANDALGWIENAGSDVTGAVSQDASAVGGALNRAGGAIAGYPGAVAGALKQIAPDYGIGSQPSAPAATAPKSKTASSTTDSSDNLSTNPNFTEPDPEETTANTPEAGPNAPTPNVMGPGELFADQNIAKEQKVYKPKLPTIAQDVHAALKPDEQALAALPGDYQSAMGTINQYLGAGTQTGIPALNAADEQVNKDIATTNQPVEKALGGLSKAAKEYEGTVPYSSILQAMLGYGKYQETYQGVLPNTQGWNTTMQSIYSYLANQGTAATGAGGAPTGLPSPTTAASQPAAGTQPAASLQGGGNG